MIAAASLNADVPNLQFTEVGERSLRLEFVCHLSDIINPTYFTGIRIKSATTRPVLMHMYFSGF